MFHVRSTALAAAAFTCLATVGVAASSASAAPSPTPSAESVLANAKAHRPAAARAQLAARSSSSEADVVLHRVAGKDRYTTSVEISKRHFPDAVWPDDAPVDVVTIASGTNYPDALAGGPFAAGLGPLLLVPSTGTVPTVVKAEIQRLAPQAIVILGGTGAVSSGIETQLKALGDTMRLEGGNRYATAAQVALAAADVHGGSDTVVLASGEGFADSLAGGSSAANQGGTLLLTRSTTLSPEAKYALQQMAPTKVQVLGGAGAVSNGVMSAVSSALPGATVTRVYGADRAATAAAISKVTYPTTTEETFFVNGWNYPDALAAAPLSWFWSTSVLMSRTACAPAATITEDARLAPIYRTAIGGTGAVSDAALNLKSC